MKPSPWTVQLNAAGTAGVVVMSPSQEICYTDGYHTFDLQAEDARVIAAAPELLTALKFTADWLSSFSMPPSSEIAEKHDALRIILAAIAKAEGR